jgi:hypothetical protein
VPPKQNPLQLNTLQLKTLTILQELAGTKGWAREDEASGDATILGIPHPHGDHFHVGSKLVMSRDATGLFNEGVWRALERKGLAKDGSFPQQITLTAEGRRYDTGMAAILHGGGHH